MKKHSKLFKKIPTLFNGVYLQSDTSVHTNQKHTNEAFSEKWLAMEQANTDKDDIWKQMQFNWYLTLYGYNSEKELATALNNCNVVLDAGCGLGYKAAWFAKLAPETLIIAMDFSDAIFEAAQRYKDFSNIIYVKGDIANTGFLDNVIDLVSCDQVLHHTESPLDTVKEFFRITNSNSTMNTYVYAKKALPRELLDDYFRTASKQLNHDEIWELSQQLTELGKRLTELDVSLDVPEIPLLGIKGGKQDIQRFIYWNFIKCFWNEEQGQELSVAINFDWYSPSNAFRYSKQEFLGMCEEAGWYNEFLHSEEACWSGRFIKKLE